MAVAAVAAVAAVEAVAAVAAVATVATVAAARKLSPLTSPYSLPSFICQKVRPHAPPLG